MIKKTLKPRDIEKMFGEKPSSFLASKLEKFNLIYSEITPSEFAECLLKITKFLLSKFVVYSGKHRFDDWERGWGENLKKLEQTKPEEAVKPGYFGKYPIVRICQRFVRAESKDFERNSLSLILAWLADKYMRTADSIYEFGCGTGHHLLSLREINPTAHLWGLDWVSSSQKIINKTSEKIGDTRLKSHKFDFFNPNKNFHIEENGIIYTVASLEQTGNKYKKFVEYLIKQKPKLVIHIEPVGELLDENNLLDFLSIKYFEKRKYLSGLLNHLKKLETDGKIEILKAQRTYIGSLFIDEYSVIIWNPL